jgi:hypothetical protein
MPNLKKDRGVIQNAKTKSSSDVGNVAVEHQLDVLAEST